MTPDGPRESDETPVVSVVIAHPRADAVLERTIAAHRAELGALDELLVVLGEGENEGALTPELWRQGLAGARGVFVRLTIGSFVPEPGWRAALLSAHAGGADAVGGAMLPGDRLRARDWAIFFQRYRNYRPPFELRSVSDVPGDHASYRRSVLEETADLWRAAFWERDVNRELHRRGRSLVMEPRFRARYEGRESARLHIAHRFRHGIQFGRERLRGAGADRRLLFALAFLLPGAVFLLRIARESLSRPGSLAPFLRALPWLLAFVGAWSFGEWIGALRGPPEEPAGVPHPSAR